MVAVLAIILIASQTFTPKLGLDLRGGTTITLTARNITGTGSVDQASLAQAQTIITQRVNSMGVGEAEITLSGRNQIQVSVPNVQQDQLVQMVGQTAQLEFRQVYASSQAAAAPPEGMATELPTVPPDTSSQANQAKTELPTDTAGRQSLLQTQLAMTPDTAVQQTYSTYQCGDPVISVWDQFMVTCLRPDVAGTYGNQKFLLGPRILEGSLITQARAGIPQNQVSYVVNLSFNALGTTLFSDATTYLTKQQSPMNQFAIVLDGEVISAPVVNEPIPGGNAQISGSFTQQTATNLANVLRYGALPLTFELSNVDTVSATLGGNQLTAGLIAGGIGLLLVVVYCVVYYRGLAIAVVAGLAVAGIVTYMLIVLLGTSIGFALSLPALAGVIVAIGTTADSFIIFFERVRDEAREGRSIRTAVETGWQKARRTVVIADCVSLLSAVILYVLAIGTVKGFAFTLGLTILVDLAVIFFFTKPLVSLLCKTAFFGEGHRFSGLEAEHLGIAATRRPRPSRSLRAQAATSAKEA